MDYQLIRDTILTDARFAGLTDDQAIYDKFVEIPQVPNPIEQPSVLADVTSVAQIMAFLSITEKKNLLQAQATANAYFAVMAGAVLEITTAQDVLDCIDYALAFLFEVSIDREDGSAETTTTMRLVELGVEKQDRMALYCISHVMYAAGLLSLVTKDNIQNWLMVPAPDPNWSATMPGEPIWAELGLPYIKLDDVTLARRL